MVRKVALVFLVTALIFCLSNLFLGGLYMALSCLAGVLIGGANMAALAWAWSQIIFKKNIALAVSVIVFKYAILGTLIYLLIVQWAINGWAFFWGLSAVIPTVIALGFFRMQSERQFGEIK